jgi:hypothetical protein
MVAQLEAHTPATVIPLRGVQEIDDDARRGRPSIASQLVALVRDHAADLCRDADGTAYVRYGDAPRVETWPLESRAAREWMAHMYYRAHGAAPRAQALADALATLSGIARYDGALREVHLRTARHDGAVVHDLGDEAWRAVTITPDGWTVGAAPVIFRRPAASRALAEPARGGTIGDLIDRLDLPGSDARHVIVWTVAAILGAAPVPIMEIAGPAGAGKTTLLRRVRSMIDPCDADARAAPRSVEDLYVAAHHAYVVAADNISHVTADVSDALCVVTTGGGYARRSLYTTADETVLRVRRPVIVTAVTPVITASDLLDRAIALTLAPREDRCRATETSLEREWHDALPETMGAIYDLAAAVLRERGTTRLRELPRMADYAMTGETISRICGWPGYAAEYAAHRHHLAARAVDGSPVAAALVEMMGAVPTWSGPIGALAGELARWRTDADAWPRSARGVADAIRRTAPGLAAAGIMVRWDPVRRRDGYHVAVRRTPKEAS